MFKKDQQQQRDLFESERNFRLLVEGVADYALYMLDLDGVVTSWNIGGQRIKGYAPDEIIGQHFSRFYTEVDRANGKPLRALLIAREQGRYEEEGWRVRKDGTFFWASVIIDPIYEDGTLVGFAKITRDITERREAQLKLEQIHQQLAESQKLDALGQLTGGVAHDFNNLLMIISGSLYTLRKAVGDDPKSQRALSAIEGATKRGASLTSQLLTFARRQSVNPQTVDVAERIDAVREVLDAAVGSAVTLQFDVEPGVWPVMVDVAEFETALVNLVINARDAMTGGGVIIISAHNDKRGGEAGAGHVAISVQDSGTGIAPDILSKIFDPFFTTKFTGRGLGLAAALGIVRGHKGAMKVYSTPGRGTTFKLLFPAAEGKAVSHEAVSGNQDLRGEARVLVVDDEEIVRRAARMTLERYGYSVMLAENGQQALDLVRQSPLGFDVVLLDLTMPVLSGEDTLREIRKVRPTLPVILSSGFNEVEALRRFQGKALNGFVQKPYTAVTLAQRVKAVLSEH